MMVRNTNLAYDLERFETRPATPEKEKDVRGSISVRSEKAVNPVKIVILAVLAAALGFSLLYSHVVVNELNVEINQAERNLRVLESENVRMMTELEGKMSLKEIETKAVNEYGMIKPDSSQVSYVKFEQESTMETIDKRENFFEKIVRIIAEHFE